MQFIRELAKLGKVTVMHYADGAEVMATQTPSGRSSRTANRSREQRRDGLAAFATDVRNFARPWLIVMLAVAYFTSSALLALFGAIPLTIGFFSATLFLEQNPELHPKSLVWLEEENSESEEQDDENSKQPVEQPYDASWPKLVADGRATKLSAPIRKALEATSSGAVSALILIGDGKNTAGGKDSKDYEAAAEEAAEKNVPILTLAVGDKRQAAKGQHHQLGVQEACLDR